MQVAMLDVLVMVAVSEDGMVTSSVPETGDLTRKRQHDAWLKTIVEDKRLWTLKTIKTQVPLPTQFEDQTIG